MQLHKKKKKKIEFYLQKLELHEWALTRKRFHYSLDDAIKIHLLKLAKVKFWLQWPVLVQFSQSCHYLSFRP